MEKKVGIRWSSELESRFAIQLGEDLTEWFDAELWRSSWAGEMTEFVTPGEILDAASGRLWGGLMPPDGLPIAHDLFGDSLMVRFDARGAPSEFVIWHHEGSHWTSVGPSLPEALLYDLAVTVENVAEDGEAHPTLGEHLRSAEPLLSWVWERAVGDAVGRQLLLSDRGDVVDQLFGHGLCRTAARALLCARALTTPMHLALRSCGTVFASEETGIDEQRLWVLLGEPFRMRKRERHLLSAFLGVSPGALTVWNSQRAGELARASLAERNDLAWPHAVLMRLAEERGDWDEGARWCARFLLAPEATQDFTRTWLSLRGPYSEIHRRYAPQLERRSDYPAIRARTDLRIREYWSQLARTASDGGDHLWALRHWFWAGWDSYCFDDIEDILEALVDTAATAGVEPLHRIASHHVESMA